MARTAASAHVFMRLAQATRAYRDMQEDGEISADALKSRAAELKAAIDELDQAILSIENDLPAYMAPSIIRELTMQRRFACTFGDELNARIGEIENGATSLPEIECLRTTPIRWVGKAHKGD
jgi:chromosome segregation ATPase